MPRTPVRRVGQESASLQAVVPWCSSCNGLMREMVRCTGEVNYFRDYKRLGPIAKLATSYLLKPYLRVFRGLSKYNLSGYVGFFQFLRNFRQQNAFELAELILQAALDPTIASRARGGEFVKCLDHFDLLQTPIN